MVNRFVRSSSSLARRSALVLLATFAPLSAAPGQSYPLWQSAGAASGEGYGYALARGGDLDGDQAPELFVGAPNASPGGLTWAGQTSVLSGATGWLLFSVEGVAVGEALGKSVASAGDLDGDGLVDGIAGVPLAVSGGLPWAGEARVFSGVSGGALYTLAGTAAYDRFAASLAAAGDLDADGVGDILVGIPGADPAGVPFAGRVMAFSGATAAPLLSVDGSTYGAQLGWSVASAGDVDGDGVPDVLAGAPRPFSTLGEAKVFSGATGAPLLTLTMTGVPGGSLGYSVAGPGDTSGDGVPDLLVGAPYSWIAGMIGSARLYSGATGGVLFTFPGTSPYGEFGYAVAASADLSGDGVPDLLVASRTSGGGPFAGYARIFSGSSGALLFDLGSTPGDCAAGAGDLDGDGVPEALLGGGWPGVVGTVLASSVVGVPSGSSRFGGGCAGSGGALPRIATAGGEPLATGGNPSFRFYLSKALGGAFAVLVLGTSSQSWLGVPLPLDLTFLGSPGCSLLVSGISFFPAVVGGSGPGAGIAAVSTPIPPEPALVGASHYFQWYVVDPGPALAPGAMSDGLALLYQ